MQNPTKHYLYVMDPLAQAPAGIGTVMEWFYGYKWRVEGDTWVPVQTNRLFGTKPKRGDTLWFVFCNRANRHSVVGHAELTGFMEDGTYGLLEFWYKGGGLGPDLILEDRLLVEEVGTPEDGTGLLPPGTFQLNHEHSIIQRWLRIVGSGRVDLAQARTVATN